MNSIKMLYFDRITFLKELVLIKQLYQKSVIFVTICFFQTKDLSFNHMYAIVVMIY